MSPYFFNSFFMLVQYITLKLNVNFKTKAKHFLEHPPLILATSRHCTPEACRHRVSDKIVMNHPTLINAAFILEGIFGQMRRCYVQGAQNWKQLIEPCFRGTTLSSKKNNEGPQCEETTNIPGMRVGYVARLP
jgi:hypothetical protein